MPYQCYDEHTERVAGMRRLEQDDCYVNPHNLLLTMFCPSSVHVLVFDPRFGVDTARQYAGKYCSKPEKWFGETRKGGSREASETHTTLLGNKEHRLKPFTKHVLRRQSTF